MRSRRTEQIQEWRDSWWACLPRTVYSRAKVLLVQSPAGTALSAHLSPGKHLGSLAFLQLLTPLAFRAVFAGQTVKNITFYVSKIHNKTIKGCMAVQCIVTAIKIVVTCSQRLAPAFECQKFNLWLSKDSPLPPFFFPIELILLILKMPPVVISSLPHCIFRSIPIPLLLRH